ncbi:type II toxin-antitoxin system CcdA family antitoxin [Rahnella selenatireducens]|uniref:type II toxin-antitoxin system CcdA family antitoxin n=1 Tax=Rahnella selenatireducens TaxID=3389797 RepID=UPI00396976C0
MTDLCDTIMRMINVYGECDMSSVSGTKKRTNVTLSADLLEQAKAFGINLSATFDKALGEAVKEKKRKLFLEENQQAMDSCNAFTEDAGLFSTGRGVL